MPASSQTQLRSCVLRCGRSGFAVDYWGRDPCVGAVFLTHAHADHLWGLSEAWEPDGRTVYCSSVTKALLLRKFPRLATRRDVRIETLAPNASVVLRLPDRSSNSTRTSISRLATVAETLLPVDATNDDVERHENENDELLTVTALDAGHCPGSVAFLFEGACGRVFHTGDWRREDWCGKASTPFGYAETNKGKQNDARKSATKLPRCLTRAPLDLVLLDNTYGDPSYVFPSRHEAASAVCGLIKKIFDQNENADVYVGVDSLGKEPLLAAIARAIGEPVRVTPERFHASIAALEAAKEGAAEAERGDADDDDNDDDDDDDDRLAKRKESDGDPFLGAAPRGSLTCASTSTCRVFALSKQRVTREKLAAVAAHTGREIVGILPTGWAVAAATATEAPNAFAATAASRGEENKNAARASARSRDDFTFAFGARVPETTDGLPVVHAVPYSLHASYDELEALVRALRPRAIVGNTRAPRNRGAPTLDVAAHFKDLCGGGDDDDDAPFDASASAALRHERRLSKRETETEVNGDVLARARRRALAPRGHFVSHAFNAFDAFDKTDVVDVVDAPARRLRLKSRADAARSRDARARDEVDDAPVSSAVPAEDASTGKSPFFSSAKAKEKAIRAIRAPNSPVAFASELAILTKTYVDAVSRLVRAFPKRARGSRRGADAPAERVSREGQGAPADADDEETFARKKKKKKRRHVPRWVADFSGVADARAARA